MNNVPDLVERLVQIFKALGDPARLRILGAVAERPKTGTELAKLLKIGAPTVSHHMERLTTAGLVSVTRAGQSRVYTLDENALRAISGLLSAGQTAELGTGSAGSAEDADDHERAKILRDFFDGPRLKQIPAQRKKRVVVLQHLVAQFEPSRDYPEKEVNDLLRRAHHDVATLRRELVDYGFMTRAGGVYRVAHSLPTRGVQVNQEIIGDEHAWLRNLLRQATH